MCSAQTCRPSALKSFDTSRLRLSSLRWRYARNLLALIGLPDADKPLRHYGKDENLSGTREKEGAEKRTGMAAASATICDVSLIGVPVSGQCAVYWPAAFWRSEGGFCCDFWVAPVLSHCNRVLHHQVRPNRPRCVRSPPSHRPEVSLTQSNLRYFAVPLALHYLQNEREREIEALRVLQPVCASVRPPLQVAE